jgi:hypothetical protein
MLSKCAVERAGYEDAHAHAHGYEEERMKWLSYAQTWSKNRHN